MLKGKLIITKKRLYAAFFFNLFEMKIKLSYNELKLKMQYYCSYQERCHNEVLKKLKTYHVASNEKNNIISELISDDFLNETRFAKSFTRGKFKFKNWGKRRIILELKKRKLSMKNIEIGLNEIEESDYKKKFNDLFDFISNKHIHLDKLKRKKKIFDYLIYRGWVNEKIFEKFNDF